MLDLIQLIFGYIIFIVLNSLSFLFLGLIFGAISKLIARFLNTDFELLVTFSSYFVGYSSIEWTSKLLSIYFLYFGTDNFFSVITPKNIVFGMVFISYFYGLFFTVNTKYQTGAFVGALIALVIGFF